MIAAESGNLTALNYFLKSNSFSVSYAVDGMRPIDFAYKNQHFEIVLKLLNFNSPFPSDFNANLMSDELKYFVNLMNLMHESILSENKEKVLEIIENNSNLRYFYNSQNESALGVATKKSLCDIYEVLVVKNLFYGSTEDYIQIILNLSKENGEKLREINFKNSRNFSDKHVMKLVANSTVGGLKSSDTTEKQNLVIRAFNILNKINEVKKVLELSAAAENLQIVFDFENENLQYLDPTASPYDDGSFYNNSGQIGIAAKKLLDPKTEHEVFGVLAHELCHFAIYLLHNNMAKPYAKNDQVTFDEFEEINKFCEENKSSEKIIDLVYTNYVKERQHAELAVRVPHMLANYYDDEKKVQEVQEIYENLFKFFNETLMPAMEIKIAEIKNEIDKKLKLQKKKISLLWRLIFTLMILAPIGILIAVILVYVPIFKWEELSHEDKNQMRNLTVEYCDVEVKLGDLFKENSTFLNYLTSPEIADGLEGKPEKLNQALNSKLNQFIFLVWSNMTENLKDKVLRSRVNFQGLKVTLDEILPKNSSSFNFLTCDEIKILVHNDQFNITEKFDPKLDFYVPRKFYKRTKILNQSESNKNNRNLTILNVLENTEKSKIFILSDGAGTGKSTSLMKLSVAAKDKWPTRWVFYFDLKKYSKEFEV